MQLAPPDRAVVDYALRRGYLSSADCGRISAELAASPPGAVTAHLARVLSPEQVPELRQVYERAGGRTTSRRVAVAETAETLVSGGGSAPGEAEPAPQQIGPYQIEGELGRGAMGVVYRARAFQLDPRNADVLARRAQLKLAMGDRRGALADCDRAVKIAPRMPLVYVIRGRIRMEVRDKAGAVADLRRFLELEPNHPDAAKLRALLKKFEAGG